MTQQEWRETCARYRWLLDQAASDIQQRDAQIIEWQRRALEAEAKLAQVAALTLEMTLEKNAL